MASHAWGTVFGALSHPKDPRLGVDLAGRVEAVGGMVTQLQVGDEVSGRGLGAFAEYVCARGDALVSKPANMTFMAAAAVPVAALIAFQALCDIGQIQPGQTVVIDGASGGVGTFAVQIAKAFGVEVTAVCSTPNVAISRSLGADHIIDYTQEDFTRNGQRYDLILNVNGYHPIFAYRRALHPTGRYIMLGASTAHLLSAVLQAMLIGPVISRVGKQKMGSMGVAKPTQKNLVLVKELLEAGKVTPVIDRQYPLRETAEAIRYLEVGHARGKVVITMTENSTL